MAKSTQAHLSRTFKRHQSLEFKEKNKRQMEYYMGAKLIEVEVNPQSALYRWSVKRTESEETWTYHAYWGESKEQVLSGKLPLTGTDLIDCARANALQGKATTALLCGYGEDFSSFETALLQAGQQMGLKIQALSDLLPD